MSFEVFNIGKVLVLIQHRNRINPKIPNKFVVVTNKKNIILKVSTEGIGQVERSIWII